MNQTQGIREFWGELYRRTYPRYGKTERMRLLCGFISMLRHRQHLSLTEMPARNLKGKRVLDLGCGAGAHSFLFRFCEARVISTDISIERARASKALAGSRAVVADMRHLPFKSGAFDIVHSNGVIHHAPEEHHTLMEIYRVLKTGGLAAVMIYAKHSFLYWCVLFPIRGILLGGIFREGNWLGRATEWLPQTKQKIYNPYTSVFSEKEARALFRDFQKVRVRKNSFVFDQIPLIGKWLGRLAGRWTGYNDGGILAYGRPWRNETRLELWLGKYAGFCLNIRAEK